MAAKAAGRPTKLSEARIRSLRGSIAQGSTREVAAKAAGIHPTTIWRWQEHGEAVLSSLEQGKVKAGDLTEQDRLAARFCNELERASAEAEETLIECARTCALGHPAEYDDEGHRIRDELAPDGRLALEFLGRRYPQRWAKRLHVRDETPREPAPVDVGSVAELEGAFRLAFGEHLPDVDPSNLLPAVAIDSTAVDITDGDE